MTLISLVDWDLDESDEWDGSDKEGRLGVVSENGDKWGARETQGCLGSGRGTPGQTGRHRGQRSLDIHVYCRREYCQQRYRRTEWYGLSLCKVHRDFVEITSWIKYVYRNF